MLQIPRPDKDTVGELYTYLRDRWNNRFSLDRPLKDLIYRRNKIEVLQPGPDKNMTPREIHSGRAGGIIEHARGLLMALPSFQHASLDDSTEEQLDSDRIEKIAQQVFQKSLVATDFWPAVGKDVLVNRALVKCHTLPSALTYQAGYPVRQEGETAKAYMRRVKKFKAEDAEFPFLIMHVPMLNCYPLVDPDDNVVASLEVKRVMAGVLSELGSTTAKEAMDTGGVKWFEDLVVLEYMDCHRVLYFVSTTSAPHNAEEAIDVQSMQWDEFREWYHGLGVHPMVFIPGIKTGETVLEDRYKSFLDDAYEALTTYDFLLSRLGTMVEAYYLPSYVLQVAENSAQWTGKDRPKMKVNLGGVTTIYSDEGFVPLPSPQGLPDANTLLREMDDIIQRHTLEDVLFGRVVGSAPAFQVNLRINVARSKLTPIAQHMAQGVIKVVERFFLGVGALKESVYVNGIEVTPALAKKAVGRLTCSIEPKSPVDRNSDIGTANMASQFGLPWDWICENILGIDNPASLRVQKMIRDIETSEEATGAVMQEALSALDLIVEEEEFTDATDMMSALPGGLQEAIAQQQGGGAGGGVGRGPYPPGAAPQTLQGGRGLLTENEQPQPGSPLVPSMEMG